MLNNPLLRFLVFWGVNTLSLWVAGELFDGISFATPQSLLVAGLMLGIVNTFLKPLLVILTLPLSILTLGLFVLVINALMLLLVAWLVPGFIVAGLAQTGMPPYSIGYVYLPALLVIVAASVISAPFGARAAHRWPVPILKRAFAFVLYALAAYMLWRAWR